MPLENGNDTPDENKARRKGIATGEAIVLTYLVSVYGRRDLADEYANFMHGMTAIEFIRNL